MGVPSCTPIAKAYLHDMAQVVREVVQSFRAINSYDHKGTWKFNYYSPSQALQQSSDDIRVLTIQF